MVTEYARRQGQKRPIKKTEKCTLKKKKKDFSIMGFCFFQKSKSDSRYMRHKTDVLRDQFLHRPFLDLG